MREPITKEQLVEMINKVGVFHARIRDVTLSGESFGLIEITLNDGRVFLIQATDWIDDNKLALEDLERINDV